jgi:hypothetical protein
MFKCVATDTVKEYLVDFPVYTILGANSMIISVSIYNRFQYNIST